MAGLMKNDNNDDILDSIPADLSILPLRNTVAFPFAVLPLVVGVTRSIKLVEDALEGNRIIGLVSTKDPSVEEPQPGQVYETGTVARISDVSKISKNSLQIMVQGLERFRVEHWLDTEPYLRAHIELKPDVAEPGLELD